MAGTPHPGIRPRRPWLSLLGLAILWVTVAILTAWTFGALWYDFPVKSLSPMVAWVYLAAALALVIFGRGQGQKLGLLFTGFAVVAGWWFTLQPSNDRVWQPDVAQTAWAEVAGDQVTLHNVRNCDYRTETDFTPIWETRIVDLSHLTGVDLAICYWGSPYMAHPIASFQFSDAPPVCFSIETRKEKGETYSAIGGLYRQFELIYICADERDVLRLRTNFRPGEEIYLYRLVGQPGAARQRFLDYVTAMNDLHEKARWYNAATANCTTSIRTQHGASQRKAWDWRLLVNGYMDQMFYEQGAFAGGLPFTELKARARINDAAKAADSDPDFSKRIRAGRPGFTNTLPIPAIPPSENHQHAGRR
jgi:hypothetical protein